MSQTLVLDAHPNPASLCAALAETYAGAHPAARLIALRDLDFDLHMRHGYTRRMEIEPDLAAARAAVREAAHLVVVTPVWWRSVPALLKGFFDRALLPQEEYRYRDNGFPQGLLAGRTARVVATADTPAALSWLLPDTRLRTLRRGTLGFCGIKPRRFDYLAPVSHSTPEQRQAWLERMVTAARDDARHFSGSAPAEQATPVQVS